MFGNVKVDYKPCKTVTQLKRACDYILGRLHSQIRNGVVKTEDHLYDAFDCDRDHFAQEVLLTRQAFRKPIDGKKNLAYKISISFHPEDNERLTHEQAYDIAKDFAAKFFFSKGYDVLFAVHTDTAHIHAHFIIGNCNRNTGKAFRRHEAELHEMSEYFGKECASLGLQHSVRESFYSERRDRMRKAFGESQMERKGAESFKSELREVIEIECADPRNNTLDDVVRALREHYNAVYEYWCRENALTALRRDSFVIILRANEKRYSIAYDFNVLNEHGKRVRGFKGIKTVYRIRESIGV